MTNIDQLLNRGSQAEAQGRLDDACQIYRQAYDASTASTPLRAEAATMLAGVILQQPNWQEALTLLDEAREIAPEQPVVLTTCAQAYLKAGRRDDALETARKARDLAPKHALPWQVLLTVSEQTRSASDCLDAINALAPRPSGEMLFRRGLARLRLGDKEAATDLIAGLKQTRTRFLREAVDEARRRRLWPLAMMMAQGWLDLSPHDSIAREALATTQMDAGNVRAALETFRPLATDDQPKNILALGRLGLINQQFDLARTCFDKARQLLGDDPTVLFAQARLATMTGHLDTAEDLCRKALEIDPGLTNAYVQLCTILKGKVEPELESHMVRLWEAGDPPGEALAPLGFALGDIADARQDQRLAMQRYRQANDVLAELYQSEGAGYEPERQIAMAKALMTAAGGRLISGKLDSEGPHPIFVVGMPRSGTTLMESILDAHSAITGYGEMLAGGGVWQSLKQGLDRGQSIDQLIAENADLWRAAFMDQWAEAPTSHVVDKTPINFLFAPVLKTLFPSARFIDMQRNRLDVALSIYRHAFPRAYAFSHKLTDIGHFLTVHQMMSECFVQEMSDCYHQLAYADLVDKPEATVRDLLNWLNLEFEEACLAISGTNRAIATFSSVQVREGISQQYQGRAAAYFDLVPELHPFLSGP